MLLEEPRVSGKNLRAGDRRFEPHAGHGLKSIDGQEREPAILSGAQHGVRQRMLGALFCRRGEFEQPLFRPSGSGRDGDNARLAFGQRAGLVQQDGIDVRQPLQCFAAFEQDAKLRAASDGDGQGGRHRETHRAGAGNHEHCDGNGESAADIEERPDHEGGNRERDDCRDKDGADTVSQLLHGGARGLRLLDQPQDLSQAAFCADGSGAIFDGAVVVERAADQRVSDILRDRLRLAGQQRLVDGGGAAEHDAVDRDTLAGAKDDDVIGEHGCGGHGQLAPLFEHARLCRLQLGERANRVQRALACAGFQPVAQQKKAKDEENRVVIETGLDVVAREQGGPERGCHGVAEGCKRAQRDQRVHVGAAVARGPPGTLIDRSAGSRHPEQGDCAQRNCEQRAGRHGAHAGQHHGDGRRDRKQRSDEQPAFLPGRVFASGFMFWRMTGGAGLRGKICLVAGFTHDSDESVRRGLGRRVHHACGVSQQVDGSIHDAGRCAQRALDMRLAGSAGHAVNRQDYGLHRRLDSRVLLPVGNGCAIRQGAPRIRLCELP